MHYTPVLLTITNNYSSVRSIDISLECYRGIRASENFAICRASNKAVVGQLLNASMTAGAYQTQYLTATDSIAAGATISYVVGYWYTGGYVGSTATPTVTKLTSSHA
jgi:hypothetical protein